jgi:hypothetical protein
MDPAKADPRAHHRVPDEPRALLAVEASVKAYLRAFPYVNWRYGEAGERFVRSDNGHLLALAEHDPDELERQVRWTADLLAERGMPRWMLENGLCLLARSARRRLGDRPDMAEHLELAAAELAKLRRAHMSEIGFRRCAASFAEALGFGPPSRLWSGFGCILAAAVADERGGLSHAVARVHEWAADPRRFGRRWIDGVDRCIAHARRL